MLRTVTISGNGVTERTLHVRVTEEQIAERVMIRVRPRDVIADDIARDRAATLVWGKGARWHNSGQGVPHRGQVFSPAKGGGENARTGVISMHVTAFCRAKEENR